MRITRVSVTDADGVEHIFWGTGRAELISTQTESDEPQAKWPWSTYITATLVVQASEGKPK